MAVAEGLHASIEEALASELLSFVSLGELLTFADVVVLAVANNIKLALACYAK